VARIRYRDRLVCSPKQLDLIKNLSSKLGIVVSASVTLRYSKLVETLKFLPAAITMEQKSVLAFVILLSGNPEFVEQEMLDTVYNSNVRLCPNCLTSTQLVEVLNEMAQTKFF